MAITTTTPPSHSPLPWYMRKRVPEILIGAAAVSAIFYAVWSARKQIGHQGTEDLLAIIAAKSALQYEQGQRETLQNQYNELASSKTQCIIC